MNFRIGLLVISSFLVVRLFPQPIQRPKLVVHMTDIAPTIAALLHIQMPDGCIGQAIEEVLK